MADKRARARKPGKPGTVVELPGCQARHAINRIRAAEHAITAGAVPDVARELQAAEVHIEGMRGDATVGYRTASASHRRQQRIAQRARDMARSLTAWADELDDPALPSERREELTARVVLLRVEHARAASAETRAETRDRYLRNLLVHVIDSVAKLARTGAWREDAKPEEYRLEGVARWHSLAEEVIRIYGDVDAERVPHLETHREKIAAAVEVTCTNVGGAGNRSRPGKSKGEVLERLCAALGFSGTFDSVKRGKRRR